MERWWSLGAVLALSLGCWAGAAREADRPFQEGLAQVESLEVLPHVDPRPVVRLVARGTLPDACTHLDGESRRRQGQRIRILLTTRRESAARCAADPRPFSRSVVLPTTHLPRGLYTVEMNGLRTVFDLPPDPTADPAEALRDSGFD